MSRRWHVGFLSLLALSAALAATASGNGTAAAGPSQKLAAVPVTKVGTVVARDLPAPTAAGPERALPLLVPDPARYAAAKAAAAAPAGGADETAPDARPTVAVGKKLPSPVNSDDDPRLTPPDM